jgi:hypothetical protein
VNDDVIDTGIGDNADGVAVGKGIRQRVRRDSHNDSHNDSHDITINLGEIQSKLLEMGVDIKLLFQMSQERHWQTTILQGWVIVMGVAVIIQSVTLVILVISWWR